MRPLEDQSFDPHTPIDLENTEQLQTLAEALEVAPEDVVEAVGQVGTNPTAVSIWLS
jgi:hypothetical protein